MNAHPTLHDGHKAIIEYAKSIGDTSVLIVVDPLAMNEYLLNGKFRTPKSSSVARMKDDLENLGVPQVWRSVSNSIDINEPKRQKMYDSMSGLINTYSSSILIPSNFQLAMGSLLMRLMSTPLRGLKKSNEEQIQVRGPEWVGFFLKATLPVLGRGERIEIFPNVIKDPKFGIKYQTRMKDTFEADWPQLMRLGQAALGARDKFKIGRNEELVNELNLSYTHRPWKWHEILVWEGGLVPGRLEVVQFAVRSARGLVLIEESWYEK